jgi:hypothetical protein
MAEPVKPARLRELLRFVEDKASNTNRSYASLQAYRDIAAVLTHQIAQSQAPGVNPCPTQAPR